MQLRAPVDESAKLYQVSYLKICGINSVLDKKFGEIHLVLIFQ